MSRNRKLKSIDDLFEDSLRHKLDSPPKEDVIKYLFEYTCQRKERLYPTLKVSDFIYNRFVDIHTMSVNYYKRGDRYKLHVPDIKSIPNIINHEQKLLK